MQSSNTQYFKQFLLEEDLIKYSEKPPASWLISTDDAADTKLVGPTVAESGDDFARPEEAVNPSIPIGWGGGGDLSSDSAGASAENRSTLLSSTVQLSPGVAPDERAAVQVLDFVQMPLADGGLGMTGANYSRAVTPTVTVEATFATLPGCGCVGCSFDPAASTNPAGSGEFAENGSFATTTSVGLSGNAGIDGLLSGVRWSSSISYSDPNSWLDYQSNYFSDADGDGISAEFEGFSQINADMLAALRFALDADAGVGAAAGFAIEGFTNLSISYAGSGSGAGTIRVANSSDAPTAYAYYPNSFSTGGDAFFGSNARTPTAAGNYSWHTMIHEMGHSLGLKHGHQPGFGIYNSVLPTNIDSNEYSVMTYRSFVGGTTLYATWETWGAPQSYMMYDIAALQHMYGADFTTNSGNTTYSWSPTSGQTMINGAVAINPGANRIFATLWDGGGIDTYDLSSYSTNLLIDLTPGGHSVFSSAQLVNLNGANWNGLGPQYARGNIFNALQYNGDARSLIENAIGGSGNDTLIGNAAKNVLNGGGGSDLMRGGTGNDTYITDGGDTITENAGEGWDTVRSSVAFTLGANLESLVLTGSASINGTGNSLANRLTGNSGNNVLNGAGGSDVMLGGAGNDTYITDGGDTITENAGAGWDTVRSSVTFTLGANLEQLVLTGSASINGTGNSLANRLAGNGGNNVLDGAGGSDTILGGAGSDTLTGGAGADTFIFNTALGAGNVDRITDFSTVDDTIRLDDAIFTGLAVGTLGAAAFIGNTSGNATDASDRIIYETDTGNLYFDPDGNGAAQKVHFATLGLNLALTSSDFFVF